MLSFFISVSRRFHGLSNTSYSQQLVEIILLLSDEVDSFKLGAFQSLRHTFSVDGHEIDRRVKLQ